MNRKRLGQCAMGVAAVLMVLAVASGASAQTGMLRGKIVDGQGNPVEGAKVTITAKGMKNSREVKSNKKGEFVQIGLFPGAYSVVAEKEGLKAITDTNVGIGDNPPLDLKLAAAAPSGEAVAKQAALQKTFDEGVTFSKAGKFDESITKFNEAITQAPACADCYYNIGYAYSQKQDWPKAEEAYKKATEIKPDYADAWNGLANAYNQQKKLDLALEASGKAAAAGGVGGGAGAGGSASSLYNQGVILWNQMKYAEAKVKFDAAAKADPTYSDAFYRLGMANVNLGDMPGAVTAFEGYLKAAPAGPHAEEVKGFLATMKK